MQNQLAAYLLKGSDETYSLSHPLTRLGRTSENQIRIDSDKASRNHAEILYESGFYWLKDLSSKNGTWLNNQRVKAGLCKLKAGDTIRIGNTEFRFSEAEFLETVTDSPSRKPAQNPVLEMNEARHEVRIDGEVLQPPLTATEWKLLQFLYKNQHRVCSRSELIKQVWLPEVADPRIIVVADYKEAIETHISRLRQKLKQNKKETPRIEAIKTFGYKLVLF